jgi:hypothetical protein
VFRRLRITVCRFPARKTRGLGSPEFRCGAPAVCELFWKGLIGVRKPEGIDTRNGEPNHATQSLSHVQGRHVYRTHEKVAIPENRGQNSSVSTLQVPENLSHHPKVGHFSPNATE